MRQVRLQVIARDKYQVCSRSVRVFLSTNPEYKAQTDVYLEDELDWLNRKVLEDFFADRSGVWK